MIINQIAVFLENRSGRICKFAKVLADANINIESMNIADTTEFGILRAITNDNEKAIRVLKDNGFNTASTDLIGFSVTDKPGEMYKVLQIMTNADINISYLYSFARPEKNIAIILLKVDKTEEAMNILKNNEIESIF